MAFDSTINRLMMMSVFPDLASDYNFKLLSDRDDKYNCIAWAMGYDDRWVDCYDSPGHWWPNGVSKDMSPKSLIEAFSAKGFVLTDNPLPEKGYHKVVLYMSKLTGLWTHAARVLTSDIEHSKFGKEWDGQHSHNVLANTSKRYSNSSYGEAFAYMKKEVSSSRNIKDLHEMSESIDAISVDPVNLAKMRAALGKA